MFAILSSARLGAGPALSVAFVLGVFSASSAAEQAQHDHAHGDHAHHDHAHAEPGQDGGEKIETLSVLFEVSRDGSVAVEHRFRVHVAGRAIRRGPRLALLSTYEGPAGLALDRRHRDFAVWRNGESEPFHVEAGNGFRSLYCGDGDVLLEHGVHDYRIRYRADGDWMARGREAFGSFDVTGPFRGFAIDTVTATLRLPEGVSPDPFSAAVTGFADPGRGSESSLSDGELVVRTNGPLVPGHSFFLNAAWPAEGFANRSRWGEVLRQHPRIPLSVFAGGALVWALSVVLVRNIRNSRGRAEPAAVTEGKGVATQA